MNEFGDLVTVDLIDSLIVSFIDALIDPLIELQLRYVF